MVYLNEIQRMNFFTKNKPIKFYYRYFKLGLRLYRGLFLNAMGLKYPLVAGHKLTYNCNLKCKMCPFWSRSYIDTSFEKEQQILKALYNAGVCLIAFEGGEPLLRNDIVEILKYSRTLGFSTSIITNGTLLEKKADLITPYIDGSIYVSIDGIGNTHDKIRNSPGCFDKAVSGIRACEGKSFVTINTTIMKDNISEIPEIVKLAKELDVGISLAMVYGYENIEIESLTQNEIRNVVDELIKMKKSGYPIVHSIGYLKIMKGEKNWQCKPWMVANVDPDGKIILPCYSLNNYKSSADINEININKLWRDYDWNVYKSCKKCSLHCYVEPSLIQSFDLDTFINWARLTRI